MMNRYGIILYSLLFLNVLTIPINATTNDNETFDDCYPKPFYIMGTDLRTYLVHYHELIIPGNLIISRLKVMRCVNICSSSCGPRYCGTESQSYVTRNVTLTTVFGKEYGKISLKYLEDESCTCMNKTLYEAITNPANHVPPIKEYNYV